jgi:hypothetical protein
MGVGRGANNPNLQKENCWEASKKIQPEFVDVAVEPRKEEEEIYLFIYFMCSTYIYLKESVKVQVNIIIRDNLGKASVANTEVRVHHLI